ncbi:ABC transporter substrate-binding protein [Streptomyces qinglanensis]|uniref:Iron complex transport system substrate-binding protein n=1 Tax=Streptomyces qinglanensis TaxID=943816 RepID=A0A1H9TVL8_9ACTN|nr:iron-siderophore ABC transporter substrate-binding protein [Streptomyces qinglanensis]SES01420.1 iron complex transport system substrate-binding protein [Streptomyces qinglanensis]
MQLEPSSPARRHTAPVSAAATRPAAVRSTAAALCLSACALALAGCGSAEETSRSGGAQGESGTVRVTDATGTEVSVTKRPRRVVALSEMDLDSALALGVRPVGLTAGRGQQGAPAYLAKEAEGIPTVGAVTGPDIEKVVRAEPDVILAGQLADEQVLQQLKKIAPTVVTIDKTKDWQKSLELTAEVLGRGDRADAFLKRYRSRTAALKKDLGPRAGASVSVARYSAKGTAVMQQGVFISDVLADLGFERPGLQQRKGEGHSTPISDENLEKIDADWLFIGTLSPTGPDADLLDELTGKPAYRQLDAVREKHVTEIDGSKWTSLGGAKAALSVLGDIRKAMAE